MRSIALAKFTYCTYVLVPIAVDCDPLEIRLYRTYTFAADAKKLLALPLIGQHVRSLTIVTDGTNGIDLLCDHLRPFIKCLPFLPNVTDLKISHTQFSGADATLPSCRFDGPFPGVLLRKISSSLPNWDNLKSFEIELKDVDWITTTWDLRSLLAPHISIDCDLFGVMGEQNTEFLDLLRGLPYRKSEQVPYHDADQSSSLESDDCLSQDSTSDLDDSLEPDDRRNKDSGYVTVHFEWAKDSVGGCVATKRWRSRPVRWYGRLVVDDCVDRHDVSYWRPRPNRDRNRDPGDHLYLNVDYQPRLNGDDHLYPSHTRDPCRTLVDDDLGVIVKYYDACPIIGNIPYPSGLEELRLNINIHCPHPERTAAAANNERVLLAIKASANTLKKLNIFSTQTTMSNWEKSIPEDLVCPRLYELSIPFECSGFATNACTGSICHSDDDQPPVSRLSQHFPNLQELVIRPTTQDPVYSGTRAVLRHLINLRRLRRLVLPWPSSELTKESSADRLKRIVLEWIEGGLGTLEEVAFLNTLKKDHTDLVAFVCTVERGKWKTVVGVKLHRVCSLMDEAYTRVTKLYQSPPPGKPIKEPCSCCGRNMFCRQQFREFSKHYSVDGIRWACFETRDASVDAPWHRVTEKV
ncbi:hypothetical protein TWF281_009008 [Arthrobotrys megalospora]